MFQSTPPHGERLLEIADLQLVLQFQSTPPHGERLRASVMVTPPTLFQSTPPHGERLLQANTLCGNTKKTGWREPYSALLVKNSYQHHRASNLFKSQWVTQCADLPVFI